MPSPPLHSGRAVGHPLDRGQHHERRHYLSIHRSTRVVDDGRVKRTDPWCRLRSRGIDQWVREISRVYRGAVGCYGDGVRQRAPLTVATFESAYRNMDQLGDRFDLLIVDEVHHFGSGLRDEALEMTVAEARLGLTATPPRDASAVARLAELMGPTVFELAVASRSQ